MRENNVVGNKNEQRRGAIVIEATIALTAFMFIIVTMLSIVNICLVQAKVGTLINGVAKDLSYYSYLYSISGVGAAEASIHEGSMGARDTAEAIRESETVFDAIDQIADAAFDPEFWESMGKLIVDEAIDGGKGVLLNKICQNIARERLAMTTNDADTYLHKLGITDGVGGLNFTCSEYCNGGSDKIKVVCVYEVHMLRLLNVDLNFHFCQTAETRSWGSAETLLSAYHNSKPDGESGDSGSEDSDTEEHPDEENPEEENPEEEEKPKEEEPQKKTTAQYKKDNTHNASASSVVIGEMNNGTGNYAKTGSSMNMTYLSFSEEDWKAISEEGFDAQKAVTDRFMADQETAGKTFYLTDSPYSPSSSQYYDQIDWLINHGYEFQYDPGVDLYKAVKKQDN